MGFNLYNGEDQDFSLNTQGTLRNKELTEPLMRIFSQTTIFTIFIRTPWKSA